MGLIRLADNRPRVAMEQKCTRLPEMLIVAGLLLCPVMHRRFLR